MAASQSSILILPRRRLISTYHPEVELVGDIAYSLKQLADAFSASPATFNLSQQSATRRDIAEDLYRHKDDAAEGVIKPQKVLADVQEIYGEDGLLLSDVGAHKMWIARHYHCNVPNGCLIPNGFCSMGFALPGAIAASLVDPERKLSVSPVMRAF